MSQARVTDFFATRKRSRFNQDEILLNKQKKTQTLVESESVEMTRMSTRSTRSKALTQPTDASPALLKEKQNDQMPEPVAETKKSKKAAMEELKEKITRFDDKVKMMKESKRSGARKTENQENASAEQPAKTKEAEADNSAAATTPPAKPAKRLQMAELRARIQQFNQNLVIAQAKQEEASKAKPEPAKETRVSEEAQLPAYLRHKELASSAVDHSSTLTLPKTYSYLMDAFKASDTIVKFLTGRQEICTFLKLKLGIQNITKNKFELTHLGQFKTVYPQAYLYHQEKLFLDFKNDYHLTIAPNFDEIEVDQVTGTKIFSPHVLMKRLNKFKDNLFAIVKRLHYEYLLSIHITNVDENSVQRWHPNFELDKIKPIDVDELPKPPVDSQKPSKDLLNIAKDVYSSRIKEAINVLATEKIETEKITKKPEVVSKESEGNGDKYQQQLQNKKEKSYNEMLERIRAKEKVKAIESMIINSDREKQLSKLSNYIEAIRLLKFYFDTEKKATLEFNKVCQMATENLNSKPTYLECKELLELMCEDDMFKSETSRWLNLIKVRVTLYLKMDKTFELADLTSKCNKAIDELKSSK